MHVAADQREVTLHDAPAGDDYLASMRIRSRRWAYDAAFGPTASSAAVYAASAAQLVRDVAAGAGNATVFCYGATGAGKTHTMLGDAATPGVMVLALAELFALLGDERGHPGCEVRLSYLEVYNEAVRDLFAAAGVTAAPKAGGGALELREDPLLGVVVAGLTSVAAASPQEVLSLLQRGNQQRVTEPTRANATSSRSHAVLQVLLRRPGFPANAPVAKLSLIDLAGSERALATDARSVRSAEGAHINKSLLALSSCIHALVEGRRHVPYRNSRLTQLLKDSLGGGCRTAMIANVSPASAAAGETGNTLHWADRAKEIRTAPQQAPVSDDDPVAKGGASDTLVEALRAELAALRRTLSDAPAAAPPPAAMEEDAPAVEEPPARSRRKLAADASAPWEAGLADVGRRGPRRCGSEATALLGLGGAPSPIIPDVAVVALLREQNAALITRCSVLEAAEAGLRAELAAAKTALAAAMGNLASPGALRPRRAGHGSGAWGGLLPDMPGPMPSPSERAALRSLPPDIAPLSGVKAAVRGFEAIGAAGCGPAGFTAAAVAPSPGRLLSSRLFQRFAEEAAGRREAGR